MRFEWPVLYGSPCSYNAICSDTEHSRALCGVEDSPCPRAERGGTAAWRWGRKKEAELTFEKP